MRIEGYLEESAKAHPDKVALCCDGRRHTYEEVENAANALAWGLAEQGIESRDRVAIVLDNSIETVCSIFAILKVGASFVVFASRTKADRLIDLLNQFGASALVTDAGGAAILGDRCQCIRSLKAILIAGQGSQIAGAASVQPVFFSEISRRYKNSPKYEQKPASDLDPAALVYTSGSTGNPKTVVLTHSNIHTTTTAVVNYLANTCDDVVLNLLPLSHTYGLSQLMTSFNAGATLILERAFRGPREVMQMMIQENVTGVGLIPVIAAALVDLDLKTFACPRLRYVTNAAGALPVPVIRTLQAAWPHVRIFCMYGLTECMRASFLPPDQIDVRPTSVGRGLPGQEMYIVDEEGRRVGPGLMGELVVRGANVMKEYWGLPEETAKVLRDGPYPNEKVLYTGDLFTMDEDGYFYFVSRRDDIIKTCGKKVSPAQVENVLCSLEGVAEAAVVGIPDKILGQAIKAVIRAKTGMQLTQRQVIRHCAEYLDDFMVPTLVEFRSTLPRTASGKVERHRLTGKENYAAWRG
jgi:acyl-CoA synthetase (AMP-forming)/AMP-acid ligase II